MERRFHSPYRHWMSGFAFELAVFVGFVAAVAAVALLFAWIAG